MQYRFKSNFLIVAIYAAFLLEMEKINDDIETQIYLAGRAFGATIEALFSMLLDFVFKKPRQYVE